MNIKIKCCVFVIDNLKSDSIKKNDNKVLKVLVEKNTRQIVTIDFDNKTDIKTQGKVKVSEILGTDKFHFEQVYTFGDSKFFGDNNIDIVHLSLAKLEDIKHLDDNYEFVPFSVYTSSKTIMFDNKEYEYIVKEIRDDYGYEYLHTIQNVDLATEKNLLELLTTQKYLKSRINTTTIMFNLLPDVFTLEEARLVHELIANKEIDRSNFRKRCIKFCTPANIKISDKGFRPAQLYKFNPDATTTYYR